MSALVERLDTMELLTVAALLVLADGMELSLLQDAEVAEGKKLLEDGFEEVQIPFGYHSAIGIPTATNIKQFEESDQVPPDGGRAFVNGGGYPFFGGLIITLESAATSVCGSTLLSPTRVLTAAHCWWDGKEYAYTMQVVLGSSRLFSGGVRVYVIYVASHAQYVPGVVNNDLAILSIQSVPISGRVKSIGLPPHDVSSYEGRTATAVGYGRYSDSSMSVSGRLLEVVVAVISNAQCVATYGAGVVTPAVLCTGGAGGPGVCGGDSGGPLVLTAPGPRSVLIGVINFVAASGCSSDLPSGYVRVTRHRKWILAQM